MFSLFSYLIGGSGLLTGSHGGKDMFLEHILINRNINNNQDSNQEFSPPICPTKHPVNTKGCSEGKIGGEFIKYLDSLDFKAFCNGFGLWFDLT